MSSHLAARGFPKGRRVLPRLSLAFCLLVACLPALRREARAQTPAGQSGIRISQIYTRGGESGAAFSHDYVELFNGGPSAVDINQWSLHITGVNGDPTSATHAFLDSFEYRQRFAPWKSRSPVGRVPSSDGAAVFPARL
jgi:hypothetical protein